jgi:autotransporter-associated beta strand protein
MCPFGKTLNIRSVTTTMGVALVPACLVSSALAVDYTYTIPASGTSQWNAGTHWGGGTAPVSATTTTLIFTGTQVAGAATTANNDMVSGGNGFQLNKLTFSGAGPTTGTAPIFNLTGNALELISNGATTPTIALTGTGTVKTVVNISNNLVLTNNLAVSLATNLTGTLSGVISGSGALSKSTGTSTLVLSNTANSFSGGVTLSNGSLTVANIGNTSSNSALGSNGTVNISTAGNAAQFTWTGSSETSDKTIRITNSTGNANLTAQTASQTLTLSNDVLLTSASAKTLTFNGIGGFSLNGSIIGSGVSNPATALTKSGAGRLTLTGTAGDFTGAVTVSQGEIYATTLGSTTSASSLGKGSTINLGGSANNGTLRLLGTSNETTDKTLNMSGTTGGEHHHHWRDLHVQPKLRCHRHGQQDPHLFEQQRQFRPRHQLQRTHCRRQRFRDQLQGKRKRKRHVYTRQYGQLIQRRSHG